MKTVSAEFPELEKIQIPEQISLTAASRLQSSAAAVNAYVIASMVA